MIISTQKRDEGEVTVTIDSEGYGLQGGEWQTSYVHPFNAILAVLDQAAGWSEYPKEGHSVTPVPDPALCKEIADLEDHLAKLKSQKGAVGC